MQVNRMVDGENASASNPVWPFMVLFAGLPLWWVLGVWQLLFLILAIPMGAYLLRRPSIEMPRGFGLWLLVLVWLLMGVLVLQVNAPEAVPGANMNRYLVFAFRFGWYLAATIAALYVVNTRHSLSSEKILRSVAWLFVFLVGGGLLGLLVPGVQFPSLLNIVLPGRLANIQFILDLTYLRTSQVHDFLGDPSPRPSAPFPYTNDWGFAIAMALPFFVAAWWPRGRAWRVGTLVILSLALVTIVASLNRGTWIVIIVAAVMVAGIAVLRGNIKVLAVVTASALLLLSALGLSPLGALIGERIANGQSDSVRTNLALTALESTARGSPVMGFGTTRTLAGTFSSIAGGATDACPKCEPPPIGTHGQIWEVAFAAGFVGLALYVVFFAGQLLRSLRVKSTAGTAALAVLGMLLVALPFYSAYGVNLYLTFIAIGLLARESALPMPTLQRYARPVFRHAPTVAIFAVLGATAGLVIHSWLGAPYVGTQRVLVPLVEIVPVPGTRPSTLDSEAALVRSDSVIAAVAEASGASPGVARDSIQVSAEPNSRVLIVSVEGDTPKTAASAVEAAVDAFIEDRSKLLEFTTDDVYQRLTLHQNGLGSIYRETRSIALTTQSRALRNTIASVREQSSSISDSLLRLDESHDAIAISNISVTAPRTHQSVRMASGMALGVLFALPLIVVADRRLLRLRPRMSRASVVSIPVLGVIESNEVAVAASLIDQFAPVAGVVADPSSARGMSLVAQLDRSLGVKGYSGARVFVVAEGKSRLGRVEQLIARMRRNGLDPVGIIVCQSRKGNTRPRLLSRHSTLSGV